MAAAVWLIYEETIYPGIISQSIMALTEPPCCLACRLLRTSLGMPAHNSQEGRHKMARSDLRQSALTGYPTVDRFMYGTA